MTQGHTQVLPSEQKDAAFIDDYQVKKSALIFRAINHKLRQDIILLIHEKEKIEVTQVYSSLGIEQCVASQHLAILRNNKLVVTERKGKYIYYSLNYTRLHLINDFIKTLVAS